MTTQTLLVILVLGAHIVGAPLVARWLRRRGGSGRLALWSACAGVVLACSLWALLHLGTWRENAAMGVVWGWSSFWSAAIGYYLSVKNKRMCGWELTIALLVTLEFCTALVLHTHAGQGIASTAIRSLLLAPACLGLCAYFGMSLGYLALQKGSVSLFGGYEMLLGRRFLLAKSSPVVSVVTTLSVFGIALGVLLVVFSLAVLGGFENDLRKKIIGANAHTLLETHDSMPFVLKDDELETIRHLTNVLAASPFIEGEVALASRSNYTSVRLLGIVPESSPDVIEALKQMQEGSLMPLMKEGAGLRSVSTRAQGEFPAPAPIPHIILGNELARTLNVRLGDRIRAISPVQEVLTPLGPVPRTSGFRVAGVFSTKMYEYDARNAYVSMEAARRFFQFDSEIVSGVHLRARHMDQASSIGQAAVSLMGDKKFRSLDWKSRNQTLFAALELERVVAFVVLVFIILVAAFSIVTTLAMAVIAKRKEIAILKTMGAHTEDIMKAFLIQGMIVGVLGTVSGAMMAVAFTMLLERFGFWIPGDVYYIDSLPIHLNPWDVVLVVVAALLIVWDFAVFPAFRGAQLDPVEGLRDG